MVEAHPRVEGQAARMPRPRRTCERTERIGARAGAAVEQSQASLACRRVRGVHDALMAQLNGTSRDEPHLSVDGGIERLGIPLRRSERDA